jgi:putative ABC transport system substrate-binding protein
MGKFDMQRRDVMALASWGLAEPGTLLAQTTKKYRIYMVTWRGHTLVEKGFQDYLAASHTPVEYIVRDARQDPRLLAEFVDEISRLKPDLVYTWGTSATLGILGAYDKPQSAIIGIPAVFTLVASPVGAKIVKDLNKPNRNVTGVYHVAPLNSQLDAIRSYRPFTKLGVLYNRAEQNSVAMLQQLREAAKAQGFQVIERTFKQNTAGKPLSEGIHELVGEIKAAGAQWLYLGADSYLFTQLGLVAAAAHAQALPTFAITEAVMNDEQAGVLAGLVSKYYSIGQFTAYKAKQILVSGELPNTIPVETLQKRAFIVRMDTAKRLKLLPPISLFNFAEFV